MRILYTLLWILALPFVLARLYWRGRSEPGYRQHIAERMGFYRPAAHSKQPVIWIHAVSVGETRAAEPLIRQLQHIYPTHRILLSHMTPTGRATGASLFPNNEVEQCFLPYDLPCLVRRLLTHFKPVICILMETEIWPNLIHTCQQQRIPVALVNARLSPKSLKKAQRLSRLIYPAGAALTCVAAQTQADAQRLRQAGAVRVTVTGNSKFDVSPNAEQIEAGHFLRRQFGARPVLLCASTREGEEELILDAFLHSSHAAQIPDLLLVIVPRHPQRFDLVEQFIRQRGLTMEKRTTLMQSQLAANVRVVLGDTMGEMTCYYASADIAFIGGSLMPLGGQNLIEACAVEKPVIIGAHTFNFEAISADAINATCAIRVNNARELMEEAIRLLQNNERKINMGKSALAFANQHRGATARTLALLQEYIPVDKQ